MHISEWEESSLISKKKNKKAEQTSIFFFFPDMRLYVEIVVWNKGYSDYILCFRTRSLMMAMTSVLSHQYRLYFICQGHYARLLPCRLDSLTTCLSVLTYKRPFSHSFNRLSFVFTNVHPYITLCQWLIFFHIAIIISFYRLVEIPSQWSICSHAYLSSIICSLFFEFLFHWEVEQTLQGGSKWPLPNRCLLWGFHQTIAQPHNFSGSMFWFYQESK